VLEAKYAGIEGRPLDPAQADAWRIVTTLAERYRQANVLLFSVPMWNIGIPYRLKHLIDVISQKDVLFTFDERGLNGLLGGRTVVTIAARGVQLGADFPP
jgi:FMN-dependent NADH-azoreductase